MVIVEAPAEPIVEELLLVFDADAEFNAEIDSLPPNDPGRPAHGHGGRAHLWRINGTQAPAVWTGRGGQTVRVRMVNVSNTGYVALRWPGLRQIASDQGLFSRLATPDHRHDRRRQPVGRAYLLPDHHSVDLRGGL